MRALSDFIKEWEEKSAKDSNMHVFRVGDDENTYCIEIRYPATLFKCVEEKDFLQMINSLGRQSGGVLRIYSSLEDFNTGVISIRVACCNHSYNENNVVKTLEHFLEVVLPNLKKAPL